MRLGKALARLHDAELGLADELRAVGERHAVEHDVYHLAHTLAQQCETHAERIAGIAERYGETLHGRGEPGLWESVLETVRHKQSELLGRRDEGGMLLLRDLRTLYLGAQEVEITWILVHQAAQAARDPELLAAATECHEQTATQVKWLKTRLKEAAPQVLVGG